MDIEELQLHDAPFHSLHIDYDNSKLIVFYVEYTAATIEYKNRELHFLDVRKLAIDFPEIARTDDATIFDIEVEPICTGNTRIKFTMLFGAHQPSGELKFEYSIVKLK